MEFYKLSITKFYKLSIMEFYKLSITEFYKLSLHKLSQSKRQKKMKKVKVCEKQMISELREPLI